MVRTLMCTVSLFGRHCNAHTLLLSYVERLSHGRICLLNSISFINSMTLWQQSLWLFYLSYFRYLDVSWKSFNRSRTSAVYQLCGPVFESVIWPNQNPNCRPLIAVLCNFDNIVDICFLHVKWKYIFWVLYLFIIKLSSCVKTVCCKH